MKINAVSQSDAAILLSLRSLELDEQIENLKADLHHAVSLTAAQQIRSCLKVASMDGQRLF